MAVTLQQALKVSSLNLPDSASVYVFSKALHTPGVRLMIAAAAMLYGSGRPYAYHVGMVGVHCMQPLWPMG